MQQTSELYKSILEEAGHRVQVKVVIAGVEYGEGDIVSLSTSGGLFTAPGIGSCAAGQVNLTVLPKGDIPRQAKVEPYVRLVTAGRASEWLPKGKYFIARRSADKRTGAVTIEGYDAMLKAGQVWLGEDYAGESWPMAQAAAVADIAGRMGVEVDSRTVLSAAFPVPCPVDGNGEMLMREVLSAIAVSNAGNWVMTDEGRLRLIVYGDVPAETSLLVTQDGGAITFGGVRIIV